MSEPPSVAWRAFPWNPGAEEGLPFSPSWIPAHQGQGRFDLPGKPGGVLYLAETPEHAVAERIQSFRAQPLDEADLRAGGHDLALARVVLGETLVDGVADLCDPELLVQVALRPDRTASGDRKVTQAIAARIHAAGFSGLRWWSALLGDWHTLVLFRDRLRSALGFEPPEPLTLDHPSVREAMRALGIRAGRRRSLP